MPRGSLAVRVALVAIVAVAGLLAILFVLSPATSAGRGVIVGTVDIGPFCPVQPITGCPPPAGLYSSMEVILKQTLGPDIHVPIDDVGNFSVVVNPGTYSLTLSNCTFSGCTSALPETVVVHPNETVRVQVTIDTGIR
jgi:hypothetical protein